MIEPKANRGDSVRPSADLMLKRETLERDFSNGLLSRESALEHARTLQATSFRRHIRPLHTRGLWAALAGLFLFFIWINVEYIFLDLADVLGGWIEFVPVLGIASFALSAVLFFLYFKRTEDEGRWFKDFQETIARAGQPIDSLSPAPFDGPAGDGDWA